MQPTPFTHWLPRLLAAATVAAASLGSTGALAQYSSLYVFGDSLSDSGNNAALIGANGGQAITGNTYIPTQPYGQGTYSNLGVWVAPFAAGLGLPASFASPSLAGGGDNAFGGARTAADGTVGGFPPSAKTQVTNFLAPRPTVPSSALFVIAIGGNDVRDVGSAVAADPGNAAALIAAASASYATEVGNMVDALQAKGAANIVVWDAPNVGRTPAALAQGSFASSIATQIAASFNAALTTRLTGEAGVKIFDIFGTFNAIVANPAAYGLSNVTDSCGAVTGCTASSQLASQYLFWDGIHPTSKGQALIAQAMLNVVAVPEPATVLLLAAGIAALLALRRRAG